MNRMLNGQILFALLLAGLNTIYASQVLQMDPPFASGEPGPAFLPSILCVFLYLAMARILITEFRAGTGERSGSPTSEHIPNIRIAGPLVATGLTVLFIVGFFYLGYLVSAFLYTFLIALFFNYERSGAWRSSALFAAIVAFGVTVFGWLFFVKVFELYLPVWEF
ncbi:tripartite tricarboxylate transporter TctB family protein [Nisaea acidiphila]|uniref:Tripartite tricarboxylate transporter TctB family protein n=1 Tax=Nisaea acidiphila TaxID=1862145 RepID=A0A9J7AP01_9PROT|nr:tripartite tricarboxylate transporter TctB family protein [Nisaea acidiphila]UUX48935.1 tripartite tricarboxylate transporter TctB family protein [Nisaea acidiphila]